MKIWKLVLIAAVAGFIYGVTSSEPPFPSLQKAAVSITRLPMSWQADRTTGCSNSACTKHTSDRYLASRDSMFTARVTPNDATTTQIRILEDEANKPTNCESDMAFQNGIANVRVAENSLSIDAENLSLLSLVEELSNKCDIEIVGKDTLADKVISAKLVSTAFEAGIRQLMRVAGIENYALSYRIDSEGQSAVSQIVLLPGDHTASADYRYAKSPQGVDSQILDGQQAEALEELASEVPEEILADVRAEIQGEVPAEMQAGILTEMLAGLRD